MQSFPRARSCLGSLVAIARRRLTGAGRTSALCAVGALTGTALLPAQNGDTGHLQVSVADAVAFRAVSEAFVCVTVEQTTYSGATDHNGSLALPEVTPQASVGNNEIVTVGVVEVFRDGYVPYRSAIRFSENQPRVQCPIVPLSASYSTPLIKAASGGTFALEGFGRVTVTPQALSQDVHLHFIPLPFESWSRGVVEGDNGERIPCDHIWMHATDAAGQVATAAIVGMVGDIAVARTMAFTPLIPEGASIPEWTAHALGEHHAQSTTAPVNASGGGRVILPLLAGHNMLTCTYTVGDVPCIEFPWEIEYRYKSTRTEPMGTVPVSCGRYIANSTVKIKAGETRETTHSLSAEAAKEVGFEGDAGFAQLTGKSSFKITGSFANTTTTVTMNEREFGVTSGDNASNSSNCFDALCVIGLLYKTFEVFAVQHTICGAPPTREKKLGDVEVCMGLSMWFEDVTWNDQCPGCAAGGTPPSLPSAR
jgi:hypothetical protein